MDIEMISVETDMVVVMQESRQEIIQYLGYQRCLNDSDIYI